MLGRRRRGRRGRQPELPVLLPDPLPQQVRDLLQADRYVEAVRHVRERTGLSLLLAVRAIDALRARGPGR